MVELFIDNFYPALIVYYYPVKEDTWNSNFLPSGSY